LQTLGNHEFDDGIDTLVSYLDGIKNIPTVVSNLNTTAEPTLDKYLLPSIVFTINSTKVGIVGYLTTDTPVIIILFTIIVYEDLGSKLSIIFLYNLYTYNVYLRFDFRYSIMYSS